MYLKISSAKSRPYCSGEDICGKFTPSLLWLSWVVWQQNETNKNAKVLEQLQSKLFRPVLQFKYNRSFSVIKAAFVCETYVHCIILNCSVRINCMMHLYNGYSNADDDIFHRPEIHFSDSGVIKDGDSFPPNAGLYIKRRTLHTASDPWTSRMGFFGSYLIFLRLDYLINWMISSRLTTTSVRLVQVIQVYLLIFKTDINDMHLLYGHENKFIHNTILDIRLWLLTSDDLINIFASMLNKYMV